jgi:hypothetical protein
MDYHRPGDIASLSQTQINLAFLHSLGDSWSTFHQSMDPRIYAMKTATLFAEVTATDDANKQSNSNSNSTFQAYSSSLLSFFFFFFNGGNVRKWRHAVGMIVFI